VPVTAISVIGRGEDDLLVPTDDGVREPQNRRTVIVLGDPGQVSQVGIGVFQDQASYCKALSDKYRQYRRAEIRAEAPAAMDEKGRYSEAIPVLEDGLIKDKIPLPSPGYRLPGKSYAPS